jgi:iron complex outermembrane receptor protein
MFKLGHHRRVCFLGSVAALAFIATESHAAELTFKIPPQPLSEALRSFGLQSGQSIAFQGGVTGLDQSPGAVGLYEPDAALKKILAGNGLSYMRSGGGFVILERERPKERPARLVRIAAETAAAPAPAQSPVAPSVSAVPEVVVTATKRAENLQNVPLSVSVVSQQALQARNLSGTTDLQRLVPGLQFTTSPSVANAIFQVRGVGTAAAGQGLEQSVGVAFDGVPLARSLGSIADLVDIERVEVLKGPQGMLFGKNASAGVLNIISQSPKLDKTEVIARAAYGTLNDQQYTGTLNIPVGTDAAVRLSAWRFKRDGFVNEVNTGQEMGDKDTQGARLKVRWAPAEKLDIQLTGEWFSHNINGGAITIRQFEPANFTPANLGSQIQAWELAHGTVPGPTNYVARGPVNGYGYFDRGSTGAYTGQVNYDLGGGTLTAIASNRIVKNDNSFDPFPSDNPFNQSTFARDVVNYRQTSGELRYASPASGRLRYVAGLFYYHLNLHEKFLQGLIGSTPVPVAVQWDMDVRNDNYAAFGEATYDITQKLHMIAGLRGSSDSSDASMVRVPLNNPQVIIPGFNSPGGTFGPFSAAASTSYKDLSWRVGLQYQVEPHAMLYVTGSKGYKGPGFAYSFTSSAVALGQANNGLVKPEIAYLIEGGLKSQWFERRLTLNISVYDQRFKDFQTSLRVPGPAFVLVTQNAKALKATGVDVDASWLVTPEFTLTGSLSYDDARYTDYQNAGCYPLQTVAQGCVNQQQSLNGWPLSNAPKWTTNLTARYETALSPQWRGFLEANDFYRSSVVFNTAADPHDQERGYSIVNLSAGFKSADARWDLTAYVNNVGDVHYVDRTQQTANGAFYVNFLSYGSFRTYGVALTAHF